MLSAVQRIQDVTQHAASPRPRIGLDTNCVQYYLKDPPVQPWADCLDPIFRAAVKGTIELHVSTVVVSELLAHAHFASRAEVGYDPELNLLAILNRHFRILDVNGDVARVAGRLRGNYIPDDKIALKTPDALIAATSLADNHTLFVTNDARLADALPDANCIYLRDAALEWLGQGFPNTCIAGTDPVTPRRRGPGLPENAALASPELGSVQPDPSAKWDRILGDAFTVAAAVNEPCVFFLLSVKQGRKTETREVLFWHGGLDGIRPPMRIVKRLHEHLGYSPRAAAVSDPKASTHMFCFASLGRERSRQNQPAFASKTDHQREADAWNAYLAPLRRFRSVLLLPQTTCLHCEAGIARPLDARATTAFLDQAGNVLGWEDRR